MVTLNTEKTNLVISVALLEILDVGVQSVRDRMVNFPINHPEIQDDLTQIFVGLADQAIQHAEQSDEIKHCLKPLLDEVEKLRQRGTHLGTWEKNNLFMSFVSSFKEELSQGLSEVEKITALISAIKISNEDVLQAKLQLILGPKKE